VSLGAPLSVNIIGNTHNCQLSTIGKYLIIYKILSTKSDYQIHEHQHVVISSLTKTLTTYS